MMARRGFSLVELAVVLTVIAAILGVVSGGITLKRSAELRGLITEMEGYRTSFDKFREIYKAVPGDFNNADALWSGDCAITITCNGDGNGVVDVYFGFDSAETARAWKHMQRADVLNYYIEQIPSSYIGVLNYDIAPKSKYYDAGYYIAAGTDIGGDFIAIASPFTNVSTSANALFAGRRSSGGGFTVEAFGPKTVFNIDKKIDDAGIDFSNNATGISSGFFRAVTGQGASNCYSGAYYDLSHDDPACLIGLQLDFRD